MPRIGTPAAAGVIKLDYRCRSLGSTCIGCDTSFPNWEANRFLLDVMTLIGEEEEVVRDQHSLDRNYCPLRQFARQCYIPDLSTDARRAYDGIDVWTDIIDQIRFTHDGTLRICAFFGIIATQATPRRGSAKWKTA
ncbi:hypothetical protein GPL17_36440 [Bradyrhizobium yuanmingense]|uniref:hypothetical protein n=1 Tax=Bradyrhizobium yuanmingense TaxID=108015 RepID=UPI0012F972DB|nr:hypothetical protein [Bradyrhizobium yuanmingense]MVT55886.1 hypothetical protein [Bradyrhizobium yuanmingense]